MDNCRKFWIDTMLKIASPVLENLAVGTLSTALPREFHADRAEFAPLEAFGRTACGIAPWLELEDVSGEEAELQAHYRELMLRCIDKATDPDSPDYMAFEAEGQTLVDAAFLCHALLRAPNQIAGKLSDRVRANLISALKATRKTKAYYNNWLLFSAMVESGLRLLGCEDFDKMRIDYAVRTHESWYLGDGVYGDGPNFHFDYYNSFVIHPMDLDVIRMNQDIAQEYPAICEKITKRATRYGAVLERLIAQDGTYPVVGRSICYRFGAFQLLSQTALQHILDDTLMPAQVRCALTAVIKKVTEAPDMFDENGWLLPGVYGHQPSLAEGYINIGSIYLCCSVFLPLGLPESDPFWSDPDADWSAKKVWNGGYVPIDHSI